jgi:hypothetical protein
MSYGEIIEPRVARDIVVILPRLDLLNPRVANQYVEE